MKKLALYLLAFSALFSVSQAQYQFRSSIYASPTNTYDLGLYNFVWDSAFVNHFKGTSLNLTGNATIGGTLTFSGLTANRLVAIDGSKNLVSTISSANLFSSIADPTGTAGSAVFSVSPTISTSITVNLGSNNIARLNDSNNASGIWGINGGLLGQNSEFQIVARAVPIVFKTGATLNTMTSGTERARLSTSGDLTLTGDLAVNGGDLTSTATTFNHLNATVTTLNTLGATNARGKIGGTAAWQSSDYVKQATGFSIGNPDNSIPGTADFRYLYVDQMHAKAFIADLEQALSGSQIIAKSVAKIDSADFTVPTAGNSATLVVEEFAGFTGRVFVDGDIVRIRNFSRPSGSSFGGSLTIADAWGTVTFLYRNGDNNPPTQAYTFTRSTGTDSGAFAQASNPVKKGTLVIDYGVSGDGFWEVDNTTGSPFARTATWTTHPASGIKTRTKLGELGSGKYGILGRDANDANDVFRIDQDGARFASAYFTNEDIWAGNASLSNINTTFALENLNTTTPTLSLGAQAASMAMTGGTGIYMDGAGNFRAATGAPITNGIRWTASSSLFEVYANSALILSAQPSGATIAGWTATASQFSSNNIALVTGAANTARVEVGTGSNIAGVNSPNASTDIAFWAGATHANRATAPFYIRADGFIYSENSPYDLANTAEFYDDFTSLTTSTTERFGAMDWTPSGLSAVTNLTGTTGRPGQIRISTTSSSGGRIWAGQIISDDPSTLWVSAASATDTANMEARIGMIDSDPGVLIGIYFSRNDNDNGGTNWFAITQTVTTATRTDTGISPSSSYKQFRIVVESSTSVKFYIDNSLVATHTTNIPSASARIAVEAASINNSTTESMDIDYVQMRITGLNR